MRNQTALLNCPSTQPASPSHRQLQGGRDRRPSRGREISRNYLKPDYSQNLKDCQFKPIFSINFINRGSVRTESNNGSTLR
jgi:hypothetical protein